MVLPKGFENFAPLRNVSFDVELEGPFEFGDETEAFLGNLPRPSDQFVDGGGLFLSFDHDGVQTAENVGSKTCLGRRFSDADERSVQLIDPLETGRDVDRVAKGREFDLFPFASDVPDDRRPLVNSHADFDFEAEFRPEFPIDFADLFLLFQGRFACQPGLVGLFAESSPNGHDGVAFVLVDEPFPVHDDVGNFLEVYRKESDEFLRFHVFRKGRESGDVREKKRDFPAGSAKPDLVVVTEYRSNEIFGQILRKGVS